MADRPSKEKAQRTGAAEVADKAAADGHTTGDQPKVTTMVGEQVGQSGNVAPGDAPADTWQADERVSTVVVSGDQMADAVKRGEGSVVSAQLYATGDQPLAGKAQQDEGEARVEQYDVTVNPLTGETARVEHNLDTGESRRV
jgi:hypothetical protein